jgi:uncharacterized protein YnzC (UPF0291/DUF896 family)
MPSKPKIKSVALTPAEKQRRYRQKKNDEIQVLKTTPGLNFTVDEQAIREEIRKEYLQSFEVQLKKERLAEERKKGRELAKNADKNHEHGRVMGLCQAAEFFIGRDRADIAQALLAYFYIDRDKAREAIDTDKRSKSMTLESLDKHKAWDTPPKIIR